MNQNCASYTFTIVIDKNLPGEIYNYVQTMFSALIVFVTPYLIEANQYLSKHFVDGVEYCGWICKNVDSYIQRSVYPALVYGYHRASDFFFDNVYGNVYDNVYVYIFCFALVFKLGRWLYMHRVRASILRDLDQIIDKNQTRKELQNGLTIDDEESESEESESEESESEEDCPICIPCGNHQCWCINKLVTNEEECEEEKNDPSYVPEEDGSVYSDSEDSENSEDEREEELIVKSLAKRREGVLESIPENTARRTGRLVHKPILKKKNLVKKVPSNERAKYVFNHDTGCYVIKI